MHILIANDDGINAVGINALIKEAVQRGHKVTVCAPSKQRSASSHAMTLNNPICAEEHKTLANRSYSINGTPVDCVRIGLLNLCDSPVDVVLSGINDGSNSGRAVIYSGTVSAAREGLICGYKAVASSIDFNANADMLENAARITLELTEKFVNDKSIGNDTLLNINFPCCNTDEIKGQKLCFISTSCPADGYDEYISPRNQKYFFLKNEFVTTAAEKESDVALLKQKYITLSFISIGVDTSILHKDFLD